MPKANNEAVETDLTKYLTKAPTDLQARFPAWITEKTGFTPSDAKSKQEAFEQGVRLAVALRMTFQASPENRAATKEMQEARKATKDAAPKRVKKAAAEPAQTEVATAATPTRKPVKRSRLKTAAVETDTTEDAF